MRSCKESVVLNPSYEPDSTSCRSIQPFLVEIGPSPNFRLSDLKSLIGLGLEEEFFQFPPNPSSYFERSALKISVQVRNQLSHHRTYQWNPQKVPPPSNISCRPSKSLQIPFSSRQHHYKLRHWSQRNGFSILLFQSILFLRRLC